MEVYEVGKTLTTEQLEIANFWDCNPYVTYHKGHAMFATKKITPGGHWIGITSIASKKQGMILLKLLLHLLKLALHFLMPLLAAGTKSGIPWLYDLRLSSTNTMMMIGCQYSKRHLFPNTQVVILLSLQHLLKSCQSATARRFHF